MIENDDRKLVLEHFRICVIDLRDLTVLLLWYEDFKKNIKTKPKDDQTSIVRAPKPERETPSHFVPVLF